MPPRRPRGSRKMKSLKGRVHVVKTEGGWVQLHKKSGSRFVFVSFGAAWCAPCKKMKPIISDMSRKPEFSAITFAEVDVEQLQSVAEEAGVKTLPTYQVWANGEVLETVTGGTPVKVIELLQKYAALARTQKPTGGGGGVGSFLLKTILMGGVVAAGVVGFMTYSHWKEEGVVVLPWQRGESKQAGDGDEDAAEDEDAGIDGAAVDGAEEVDDEDDESYYYNLDDSDDDEGGSYGDQDDED